MKTLRVKDASGQTVKGWSFGTFEGVQVGNHLEKPRKIRGWQLNSPDGQERYCEGNYQQFIPFANTILENYGCKPCFS